jgi:hypothetical protein
MEITVELLKFNIKNLNNRKYTQSSFENVDLDQEFYGQIGQDRVFCLSNSTHIVKNIRVVNDSLMGDVEIIDNSLSKLISENINEYVFRPRILGYLEEDVVKVRQIISFDAVPRMEDSWFGLDEKVDHEPHNSISLITNNFKDFLKSEDNLEILSDFMNYNLTRMNPDFYSDTENNIEIMMSHKEVYDNCMMVMVSNTIEPSTLVNLVNDMISHYEEIEEYESCLVLSNYIKDFKKEVDYNE